MNTEEYFDIVDENNQLLGITKPRSQVHAEMKDWHRATGIYVLTDQDQILCQKRSMLKDTDPGMWQNHFGGHLKAGEDYIENALNEVFEEIGLQVSPIDLLFLGIYKSRPHLHHAGIFVYRWNATPEEVVFNDGEVEKVQWMSIDEYLLMQQKNFPNKEIKLNPLVSEYLEDRK